MGVHADTGRSSVSVREPVLTRGRSRQLWRRGKAVIMLSRYEERSTVMLI